MKISTHVCRFALLFAAICVAAALTFRAQGDELDPKKEASKLLETYGVEDPSKRMAMYLMQLIQGNTDKAFGIAETSDSLKRFIAKSADLKYLRANSSTIHGMSFIGFRMLSTENITFLYVFTTKDGPVGIKLDMFVFQGKAHVFRLAITREWDGITKMEDTVRLLPASMDLKFVSNQELAKP